LVSPLFLTYSYNIAPRTHTVKKKDAPKCIFLF
jgi:hypothetical protein